MKKLVGLFIFVLMLGQLAMGQNKAPKDCTVAEIDSILTVAINARDVEKIMFYGEVGAEKAAAQYGKEDTIYAKMRSSMGLAAFALQDFANAEKYLKEAIDIQKIKQPKSLVYSSSLSNYAALQMDFSDYEAAELLYKEAVSIRKEIFGEKHPEYASTLSNMATLYHHMGKYALSESYGKQALSIQKETLGEKHADYANSLNNLAILYSAMGEYNLAEPLYKKTVEIKRATLGEEHQEYASAINNLAFFYHDKGEYALAESMYKKAMEIYKKVLGEKHPDYALSLSNLGALYADMQNYALAEPLYKEAIQITKEVLGEKHPDYIASLDNLASLYTNTGKYSLAESLGIKVVAALKEVLGENHPDYIASLDNLAVLYNRIGKLDLAEDLLKKSLAIRKEVLGEKHPDYAVSLSSLGNLYENRDKKALAEPLLLAAAQIRKERLGEKHRLYLTSLQELAELYHKMDKDAESWAYVQKILIINTGREISLNINQAWADSLLAGDYISTFLMVKTLKIGYDLLKKSNSAEAKAKQIIVSELALKLLDEERNNFSEEGDKLRGLSTSLDWVERGLMVLDLDKEGEKGFVFAEQSKSVLLLNAAQTKQAYTFGDLPDTLVQKEKKLQLQKTDLEAKIAENRPKVQIDSLRSLLNDLNLQIKDFKATIEKSYPKYAELKYEHKGANVADIQKLLPAESALIEYVVGKDATYIFYLDKKQLKINRLEISADTLKTRAEKLHRCLSNYAEMRADEAQAYSDYTEIAHWFYENMLAEPLKNAQNIKHLIVIPDGDLAYLPFETFLRTKVDATRDYSKLAYVVNDFSVSYNYSATLWKQNLAKAARKNNGLMLGIAANYATKLDSSKYDLRLPADQRLRKLLNVLPAAEKEVKSLSESFKGLFAFDNMASEKAFKANAGKYSIIHLAMHGLLDNQNPILSSLAFTEDSDSIENNFLHAYEISKMQLNADLVVLSACETGFGKFEQGNGTASLARAFMYAGVPALVVSLWEVNDGSTNILMQAFYKNLSAGMDKAEALRQAKLEYIGIAKGISGHPAFWSAFIQLGDSAPIDMHGGGGSWWLIWAIGAVVALGLVGVVLYVRNKKS